MTDGNIHEISRMLGNLDAKMDERIHDSREDRDRMKGIEESLKEISDNVNSLADLIQPLIEMPTRITALENALSETNDGIKRTKWFWMGVSAVLLVIGNAFMWIAGLIFPQIVPYLKAHLAHHQ